MNLHNLTRLELEEYLSSQDIAKIHAQKIFRNLYKNHSVLKWDNLGLPLKLTDRLTHNSTGETVESVKIIVSAYDHSVKFLFKLEDGLKIESVLMPEASRLTICLSTQVGCDQGCVFCHTGRMGLTRDLKSSEIVAQITEVNKWISENLDWLKQTRLPLDLRITNVVFMGMGEPLDNVDNLLKSISIMTDDFGLAIAPSKVSVSTAGHLPGLKKLYNNFPNVRLALSVHNGDTEKRSKILPINKKWPIDDVIAHIKVQQKKGGQPIFIQYTLIESVNDKVQDAENLVMLLKHVKAKINLIPLNPIEKLRLRSSTKERIHSFQDVLHKAGFRTLIRYSKGQDIQAACGQLVDNSQI